MADTKREESYDPDYDAEMKELEEIERADFRARYGASGDAEWEKWRKQSESGAETGQRATTSGEDRTPAPDDVSLDTPRPTFPSRDQFGGTAAKQDSIRVEPIRNASMSLSSGSSDRSLWQRLTGLFSRG